MSEIQGFIFLCKSQVLAEKGKKGSSLWNMFFLFVCCLIAVPCICPWESADWRMHNKLSGSSQCSAPAVSVCFPFSTEKDLQQKKKKRVGRKLRATFSKEKCSFVSFLHQRAAMNHSKRSRTPKHWSKEKPTLLSSAPPFFFSFRLRQKRCHCPAGRLWGWCSRLQDDVL